MLLEGIFRRNGTTGFKGYEPLINRTLMSFSFNFVSSAGNASLPTHTDSPEALGVIANKQAEKNNPSFEWFQSEMPRFSRQDFLENEKPTSETISLLHGRQKEYNAVTGDSPNNYILRVREESSSFQNPNTDLVPGVYEGGLKVWECSIDLCRYFLREDVAIKGHVLELGCGHGLPGIFILKQAIAKSRDKAVDCFVTFSDYNKFVIRDVTIPNVAINIRDSCLVKLNSINGRNQICSLLYDNVAFGAGDWLAMSDILLRKTKTSASVEQPTPPAVPTSGLFDYILASETTYSEHSATETAELLSRHLKPGVGVAYISTKRYYFGVGGGSKCLCDSLNKHKTHKFHIRTLEVHDDGAGNIREVFLVKSLVSERHS